MGIFSEINVKESSPDEKYKPGSTVSGEITYTLEEDTDIDEITVALKGKGTLRVDNDSNDKTHHYRSSDSYADITNYILKKGRTVTVPKGTYSVKFEFTFPENIPPSLDFANHSVQIRVWCTIEYYVRIKFVVPGFATFPKVVKKHLQVVNDILPAFPSGPVICGQQKKLMKLFSKKKHVIHFKGTIQNTVIGPNDRVDISYEICNDSDVVVKGIVFKVLEEYIFKSTYFREVTHLADMPGIYSKIGAIAGRDKNSGNISIQLPSNIFHINNSNIVTKEYVLFIDIELPAPHINMYVKVPLKVGNVHNSEAVRPGPSNLPTYWEAISEKEQDTKPKS